MAKLTRSKAGTLATGARKLALAKNRPAVKARKTLTVKQARQAHAGRIINEEADDAEAVDLGTRPTIATLRDTPQRVYARIGREAEALKQIQRLPDAGQDLVLMMTGRWHGFDLIGAILRLVAPATIKRLEIATLGFNPRQAGQLGNMIDDGAVGSVRMLVAEMFRTKKPHDYQALAHQLTSRGQILASRRNHAKLILFEISDGRTFAAHGSLNLRRCNAFENIEISTDPTLFAFFADFITLAIENGERDDPDDLPPCTPQN